MKAPDVLPAAVLEGIRRYARQHEGVDGAELIAELRWDTLMGCYFFVRHGLWHGVELDGYVHT